MAPNRADILAFRGLTYHHLEQYESALKDYEAALKVDKEYATAYYNRGLTYSAQGEHKAAIK